MIKNIKALARGYVLFRVNGKHFATYERGLAAKAKVDGSVQFDGFSIFKGWRGFYHRSIVEDVIQIEKNDDGFYFFLAGKNITAAIGPYKRKKSPGQPEG